MAWLVSFCEAKEFRFDSFPTLFFSPSIGGAPASVPNHHKPPILVPALHSFTLALAMIMIFAESKIQKLMIEESENVDEKILWSFTIFLLPSSN